MTLDLGARSRLEAAFAREERRGLMQAAAARSAATVAIVVWLAAVNPERGLSYAWVLGTACFFLVTGLAQFWLYWRELAPSWASYAFILVDAMALAAVLLLPNPFATASLPLPMPADILGFRIIEALTMTYPAMVDPEGNGGEEGHGKYVEGEAVLDVLTGEIVGDKEEADKMMQEAADKAEKAKKTKSTANWKETKAENGDGNGNGDENDLESKTVAELKEIAADEGVDLPSHANKADIIEAIEDHRGK